MPVAFGMGDSRAPGKELIAQSPWVMHLKQHGPRQAGGGGGAGKTLSIRTRPPSPHWQSPGNAYPPPPRTGYSFTGRGSSAGPGSGS